MFIDNRAVFDQNLDRHIPNARRRRHGQTRLHIFDDFFGRARNSFDFRVFPDSGGNRQFCGWRGRRRSIHAVRRLLGFRRWRLALDSRLPTLDLRRAAVQQIAEKRPPRFVNRVRISLKTTQQTFDITGVRAEVF